MVSLGYGDLTFQIKMMHILAYICNGNPYANKTVFFSE